MAGFEFDAQHDTIRFDVRTARTDRRCFPSPEGDHEIAVTMQVDCSSPIDESKKLAASWTGHSLTVNAFARK